MKTLNVILTQNEPNFNFLIYLKHIESINRAATNLTEEKASHIFGTNNQLQLRESKWSGMTGMYVCERERTA